MMKNKKAFERNIPEIYQNWISRLKQGKSKVNAKQLMIHELISDENIFHELTQFQWDTIRENIKSKGNLKGIIPVGDLSGSMEGLPMQVSIALSIMISELAEEPFKDLMITFSDEPNFYKFEGKTLLQKVSNINNSSSIGLNTNLIKTFEIILQKCLDMKVSPENMPNKILIITDGQFDQQTTNNSLTCFDYIKKLYNEKGYKVYKSNSDSYVFKQNVISTGNLKILNYTENYIFAKSNNKLIYVMCVML
jgi:uncharacterized protein with von Willebrand factor type A (vWA) domain